jgi:flagellar hook assembly protein FlgD
VPTEISLSQNFPNPFNPSTRIEYKLSVQSHVTVKIYNILGQEVASLVDEVQMVGNHVTQWNGGSSHGLPVSSGVYFYRLEARETTGQFLFAGVKKMILMK